MESHVSDFQKAPAFDSYVKKILKYAVRDYHRKKGKRREQETSLSGLTGMELTEIAGTDIYFANEYVFDVLGWHIDVKDCELGEALNKLTTDKRNIILLSYFLDMTDNEIGQKLNLVRSTVQYRRTSTLKELRKRLEENANE